MKTKVPDDIDPSLFVASSTVCDLATPLSAIMLSLEGAIRHLHQNPEKALKRIQRAQGSLQNAISEWIWLQYHLGVRSSQVVDLSIVVERASRFVELLHLYDEPPKFTIKKPENEIQAWGEAGEFMRCLILLLDGQKNAQLVIQESAAVQLEISFDNRELFAQSYHSTPVQHLLKKNRIKQR